MVDGMSDRRNLFKWAGGLGALGLLGRAPEALGEVRGTEARKKRHTVEGSWTVDIAYDDTPSNLGSQNTHKTAMCQFHPDGRWHGSVSAVNQGSHETWPAVWHQATYHGEWKRRGDGKVKIRARRMRTDDSGHIASTAITTIRAVLDASGKKLSGRFVTVGIHPDGTDLGATFKGNWNAVRIT